MLARRPTKPAAGETAMAQPYRPAVPPWLLSLLFHGTVFLLLALAFRMAPRQGAARERTAEVGIALKHQQGEEAYYETAESGGDHAQNAAAQADSRTTLEQLLGDQPAVDLAGVLPEMPNLIGPSVIDSGGPIQAGPAAGGHPGSGDRIGGKATVRFFGVQGTGYKFVYVLDRSVSMQGSGRSPLAAAKAELIASLDSLDKTHQFQIVFYNEQPEVFNPAGGRGRLAFATERNKEAARRFVGGITAYGSTRHETALKAAIKLQPDVIFFLTDGDQPRLSARQLDEIQHWANGITINAVEFGVGPRPGGGSFLVRLARQNGGQYAYRDITKMAAANRN